MSLRVETVMMGVDTDQYAGKGQKNTGIEHIAESARLLEDVGFDGVTMPEAGHDPFLPLMIAAANTEAVRLGTNVAIAFPRSPMVTAQTAWDLQHYSNGRFNLGLGTQVKGHNERRYCTAWTSAPGPRMREYILCLKAMFESFQDPANPTYFEGEHYKFTLMAPFFNPGPIEHPHIPIYLAAVNPYMAGLSGELCDGLRLHPIATFAYTREVLLPAIAKGAAKSGRSLSDIDVLGAPFLAIGRNDAEVEKAKNALRQNISFYASTRSYHAVLKYHGWEDVGTQLHKLSLEGKWAEMPPLISDEMLQEWAVVASYDDLADKLKERTEGLYNTVLLDLPGEARSDVDWLRETLGCLHGKAASNLRRNES